MAALAQDGAMTARPTPSPLALGMVALACAACSGSELAPRPTATATATGAAPCAPASRPERLVIAAGRTVSTRSGLEITFRGTSHDDFDDGRFDVTAALHFRRGADETDRLPSTLAAHPTDEVLDHCWHLVTATDTAATVDVAPRAP